MTDALLVATWLRGLDDAELAEVLVARGVEDDPRLRDVFDVAERLLDPVSVRRALTPLDRMTLLSLSVSAEIARPHGLDEFATRVRAVCGERLVEPVVDASARAMRLGLLVDDGSRRPLDVVGEVLGELRAGGLPDAAGLARPREEAVDDARPPGDAAAAERAFSATVHVAELITQLLEGEARELGRGGLAAPDVRRLSSALDIAQDAVPLVVEIARQAGLVARMGRTWHATRPGVSWLDGRTVDRWTLLAAGWTRSLPPLVARAIAAVPAGSWPEGPRAEAAWDRPAQPEHAMGLVDAAIARAELLGVVVGGRLSRFGSAVLDGDDPSEELSAVLPREISQVYLQDDLTVIAPGPLLPARDRRLRGMAVLETRSQASTYRFTRESVTRAFSGGEDAESVRAFLSELSLTGVPQALAYLIDDVWRTHGRVRVAPSSPGPGGRRTTEVSCDDETLLAAIAVDASLTSVGLRPAGDRVLVTPFDRDVVFWALKDARYPVVAVDVSGAPVTPARTAVAPGPEPDPPAPDVEGLVVRIRAAAEATSEEPDEAWLWRVLDTAVRNREVVVVSVVMPDGTTVELELEPTGVAGGRLRGRDRRQDVERTLPLSSVADVRRPADA